MSTVVGTCKFWQSEKGFGFLKRDDAGPDTFFLAKSVKAGGYHSEPAIGDRFSFEVEQGERGPRATNITKVD